MKKLVSVFLALVMILAISVPAFAAEPQKFTLTITGAAGHTYEVYQIFTGDIAQEGDKTVLSNILYGENYGQTGTKVDPEWLAPLIESEDLAKILKNSLKGTPITVTPANNETSVAVTDLVAGYYLVLDVTSDANMPDGQTRSDVILQVVESVSIASKHATISSTKKVADKNDSTDGADWEPVWQDAADHDIGDAVPFQMTVVLPATLYTYEEYELTIHDKQAASFDTPVISRVYILKTDNTEIDIPLATQDASGYTLATTCPMRDTCEYKEEGYCTFNIHVGDIVDLYGDKEFADGDKLIVDYTSVLNEDAVVGRVGNENSMYVCHPDGHTPKDAVTVLTYALIVNKIDGASKEALEGAGFTLQKWNEEAQEWANVGTEIMGDGIVEFTWNGIDDGKYKLVETHTPALYNTITPIEFVVDATYKTEWLADGNSAFEDVIAKNVTGDVVVFADKDANGDEDGKLAGNVENYKGTVLPETGAMGTMWLIFGGAMLVVVAAVFMITRKKMSIYED